MKSGLSCKFQPDFVHPASNSTLAPPERKSTKLFAARISEFWEPDLPYSRQAPSSENLQLSVYLSCVLGFAGFRVEPCLSAGCHRLGNSVRPWHRQEACRRG